MKELKNLDNYNKLINTKYYELNVIIIFAWDSIKMLEKLSVIFYERNITDNFVYL